MAKSLDGRRIAAIVTHGFEQSELLKPKSALEEAGATVDVISPESGKVRGWSGKSWGDDVSVDRTIDEAEPQDYDAVLLPGGVMSPDRLRTDARVVSFIRTAYEAGRPVAAICHGPWTLIEAGIVRGMRMTSWPSLRTDLTNAGATWVDEEVAVDQGLVTSRKPDDIPAFNRKMIELFAEGRSVSNRQAAGAVRS